MIVNLPPAAVPTGLLLYDTEARDTTATSLPLTPLGGDRWSADTTGLTSRWYPTVLYTLDATDYSTNLPYVDLPESPDLVVSPETLALRAGIPLPLSAADRELIIGWIRDAQADVRAYLGVPIMPAVFIETGRYDVGGEWNLTPLAEPVIEITSAVAETIGGQLTGAYTITYLAGLNAKDDPDLYPIVRYIIAHALNQPGFTLLWKVVTSAKGEVTSLSTEGQSISYGPATLGGGGAVGSGAPGSLPDLSSLDYWRVAGRRVFQRRTAHRDPWPYTGFSGDS
jgi:hypothetical protein